MPKNDTALVAFPNSLYEDEAGRLVQVYEALSTDETLTFSAQGGGLSYKLPRDEFMKNFKPARLREYALGCVTADWLEPDVTFPAYMDGRRWNGWAMPYFSFEAAKALLPYVTDLSYNAEQDAFVCLSASEGAEPEVFEAVNIKVDGGQVKAYPIGAGSWCWDVCPSASDATPAE